MLIVGKENTDMDVKNEGGNLWCHQSSFSSYVPTFSIPSPPRQDVSTLLRGNAGVALPIWSLSLEDKVEGVPGMHKDWVWVFLEGGPSSSGFPPLTLLTSKVLNIGYLGRWPASWWVCWTCWDAATFVPAELARNICSVCA